MQKLLLLLAVTFTSSQAASAQTTNALREGVRVQVTTWRAKPRTGTLRSLTNDSLFVAFPARARSTDFALAEIRSVKVSRGKNHLIGAVKKGLVGTALGIVTGGIIAAAQWNEQSQDFFCGGSRGACAAFGGTVGGALGLVAGTLYGAATGSERWQRVDLPSR